MSLVQYSLPGPKASISRSTPTGIGEAFVTITVETSFAEAARAAANNSLHSRDVILAGLRRAVQEISKDLRR